MAKPEGGDPGQRATDRKDQRDHAIEGNAAQLRQFRVLRHGPQGFAGARAAQKQRQASRHQHSQPKHHQALHIQRECGFDPEHTEDIGVGKEVGDAVERHFGQARHAAMFALNIAGQHHPPHQRDLIQDEGQPQRGDERRKPRGTTKGLEREALDHDIQHQAQRHAPHQRQQQPNKQGSRRTIGLQIEFGDDDRDQHR